MEKLDARIIMKNLFAENPIHAGEVETHGEPVFAMKNGYIYQTGTNTDPMSMMRGGGATTLADGDTSMAGMSTRTTGGGAVTQGAVPRKYAQYVVQTPGQAPGQVGGAKSPMQSPTQSPMQSPVQGPPMKMSPVQRALPGEPVQGPTKYKVTPQAKMAGTLDGLIDFITHCVGGHISFLWKDPMSLIKDPVKALKLNEIELNPMGHIKNSIYQAAQRPDPMQQLKEVPMGLDGLPGMSRLGLKQSTMGGTYVNGAFKDGMIH